MNISEALENFRYVLFTGREPEEFTPRRQEEYIELYEQQITRDPAMEAKLTRKFGQPLIPAFRKQMEQVAKMEQIISGIADDISFSDEEILDELYDDVVNMETEEEWQSFKKNIVSAS